MGNVVVVLPIWLRLPFAIFREGDYFPERGCFFFGGPLTICFLSGLLSLVLSCRNCPDIAQVQN